MTASSQSDRAPDEVGVPRFILVTEPIQAGTVIRHRRLIVDTAGPYPTVVGEASAVRDPKALVRLLNVGAEFEADREAFRASLSAGGDSA